MWLLKPSTQLTIHVENFIDDQECQEIFDWANNIEKFEDAGMAAGPILVPTSPITSKRRPMPMS